MHEPASSASSPASLPLRSIGYVSTATTPLTPPQLQELLAFSRRTNQEAGITGLLLHCGGNFMQVIEGPSLALQATQARIRRSAAHHGIIQLFDEPIEARDFADWDMACRSIGQPQLRQVTEATPSFRRQLLKDFWERNR
ncbi:BLUF domain-containing protein [Ramlibacter rhizophilus]|nr:BLUF domain-containing protein [Ramlibacter rhizophilus]